MAIALADMKKAVRNALKQGRGATYTDEMRVAIDAHMQEQLLSGVTRRLAGAEIGMSEKQSSQWCERAIRGGRMPQVSSPGEPSPGEASPGGSRKQSREELRARARELAAEGKKQVEIAEELGLAKSTISEYLSGPEESPPLKIPPREDREEILQMAEQLRAEGEGILAISRALGVPKSTLSQWMKGGAKPPAKKASKKKKKRQQYTPEERQRILEAWERGEPVPVNYSMLYRWRRDRAKSVKMGRPRFVSVAVEPTNGERRDGPPTRMIKLRVGGVEVEAAPEDAAQLLKGMQT